METRTESDSIISSEQKRPSANLSFDEIVKLLEGHLRFLFHNLRYLSKIENNTIDQGKIKDYLYDVYGFNLEKIDTKKIIEEILPKIKEIVKQKIEVYACLVKATELKDREQAICALNLLLERECEYEAIDQKISKAKDVNIEDKLQTAFHDYSFVSKLHSALQTFLPACYPDLAKIFKVKVESIQNRNEGFYSAEIYLNWNNLLRNVNSELTSILRNLQGQKTLNKLINIAKNNSSQNFDAIKSILHNDMNLSRVKVTANTDSNTLASNKDLAITLIKKRIEQNKIDLKKLRTENDKFKFLEVNIFTFFQAYPAFRDFVDVGKKIEEAHNQEKLLSEQYFNLRSSITKKKRKIANKHKLLSTELTSLKKETETVESYQEDIANDINQCQNDLVTIQQQVDDNIQSLPKTRPETIQSEIEIQSIQIDFEQRYDEIIAKFYNIQNTINFHANQIKIQKAKIIAASKLAEEERSSKYQEEQAALKKARDNFYEQRDHKLKLHKESVAKKRADKKKAKLTLKSTSTLFSEEKHVQQYKNIDMEDLLKNLSSNQLILLRAILNLENGPTYDDVCNLITNHLGGKIIEIGNGSSHKRIVINKYIIDIVTSSDDNKPEIINEAISQTATGGFFRQHGKARTERKLCHFNLELIKNTFAKAGITTEVLDKLRPSP